MLRTVKFRDLWWGLDADIKKRFVQTKADLAPLVNIPHYNDEYRQQSLWWKSPLCWHACSNYSHSNEWRATQWIYHMFLNIYATLIDTNPISVIIIGLLPCTAGKIVAAVGSCADCSCITHCPRPPLGTFLINAISQKFVMCAKCLHKMYSASVQAL